MIRCADLHCGTVVRGKTCFAAVYVNIPERSNLVFLLLLMHYNKPSIHSSIPSLLLIKWSNSCWILVLSADLFLSSNSVIKRYLVIFMLILMLISLFWEQNDSAVVLPECTNAVIL